MIHGKELARRQQTTNYKLKIIEREDKIKDSIDAIGENITEIDKLIHENSKKITSNEEDINELNTSVKESINSIEKNIEDIEYAIEDIDNDLINVENKLDQAEAILPIAKASGENVRFSNAQNYPLMSLKFEGKSEQGSLSGKNAIGIDTSINFTATKTWEEINTQKYVFKADTTYYFSAECDIGTNRKLWIGDANSLFVNTGSGTSFSLTQEQIDSITRVIFVIEGLTAGTTYTCNAYVMVSQNSNDTYEPYTGGQPSPNPEYPQEIKTITEVEYKGNGKQFFIMPTSATKGGITYTLNSDGTFNLSGTSTELTEITIYSDRMLGDGIYTISSNANNSNIYFTVEAYKKNQDTSKWISLLIGTTSTYFVKNTKEIVMPQNANTIRYAIKIKAGATLDVSNVYVQLERANTPTEYEPYQESAVPIDLQGNELCKLGDVVDKLIIDRKGNVAIEKNTGKIVFNGTENFSVVDNRIACSSKSISKLSEVYIEKLNDTSNVTPLLCNYYSGGSQASVIVGSNKVGFSKWDDITYLYFPKDYETTEEFKTWMTTHNIEVYYRLATPQIVNVGMMENPMIFKGLNDITVTTNFGNVKIEIEYVEDLQRRVDKSESLLPTKNISGEKVYFDNGQHYPIINLKGEGKSEQVTTSGKNLYNVSGINNIPSGVTVDEDGWITATYDNSAGTATKYLNIFTNNLNLKTSTKYAIITQVKSVSGNGTLYSTSMNNGSTAIEGQFTTLSSYDFTSLSNNVVKVSVNETRNTFENTLEKGIRSFVSFQIGQSGSITFRLSVLEDTTVTAENFIYEPYTGGQAAPNPEYPQEVKTISEAKYIRKGKNLFNYIDTLVSSGNGLTDTLNSDGSITTTGIPTKNYAGVIKTIDITNLLEDGEEYTFSQEILTKKVYLQINATKIDGSNNYQYLSDTINSKSFVVDKSQYSKYVIYAQTSTINDWGDSSLTITNKYMLCKGTDTTFEPYQESTVAIDLQGNELCKLGDVVDKLIIDRKGNVAIEKNIGKVVLDGESNVLRGNTNETFTSFFYASESIKLLSKIKSNRFIYDSAYGNMITALKVGISGHPTVNRFYFCVENTIASTVNDIKAWLAENPVIVYYELATPEIINLGTIENPETFKGINNIVVSTNLGDMPIEIEYVEDLQALEKRIEKVEQAIVSLGGI